MDRVRAMFGTTKLGPGLIEIDEQTLFTAVQEQLGLKLESGKQQVEMFVIATVQRPSEN